VAVPVSHWQLAGRFRTTIWAISFATLPIWYHLSVKQVTCRCHCWFRLTDGFLVERLYAIHLYIYVGCAKVFDQIFVAEHLSVPYIIGSEFMDNHVEAIFTRQKKVVWRDHFEDVTRNLRRKPILATLRANKWERSWEDQPAKVRASRQVRFKGRMEDWVMETCATPDPVTISPNIRLCGHKSVAVARGVAHANPDEPLLVKVCTFGPNQAIVRKMSIPEFAEQFQGPMLAAITEEKATRDIRTGEGTPYSDDPVENVDLSEAPEHLHKQRREMLRTHSAKWNGALGSIYATKHALVAPTDAVPVRAQPYRTGPFKRQIIPDNIDKMLKLMVIEPIYSAWAGLIVIVPKKNGKARFCVDYRRLNNIIKKDAYPLPRMEDCLESLGDAKVFTSLDCTAGYWKVHLRPADREKTAFTTHAGIYHWLSMALGLTNAPATFQRALDNTSRTLTWSQRVCAKPVSLSISRSALGSPKKSSTLDTLSDRVNSMFIVRSLTR